MRACRNETSGLVAGTSISARGLALAAGMLTVMGVGGAGVSPAQGGIVVSSVGFGFGGGDCWGDDSFRVRVTSFNSWCDEWVHRRVAWDCGPTFGSWGYRPWGYRWNSHALARRGWYEPCDIVVGDSWRWWRDPVADVYVYRPVVIAPSRPVLLPYEPSRVVAADVDGDGYIEEGESAILVPAAPVYVGAPVVWGPSPVVVYRTYRPWCPPRYYDDCYRRPIFSSVTVCDDDWWGSTRVSVSITIGLGSRSWNHWNRWDRCDDWRRWDDRWSGPVLGPRRDQVTINNPVFNGPVYFNGNTNVNGGVFAPNGPTQIAAGPVVAPAVVPAVATVRESKESGRGGRRSGVDGLAGETRVSGGEVSRDVRRAEGSRILTGEEAASIGRIDRTGREQERSASRGASRLGETVENNEPKRPSRVDDGRRADRGGDERKPSVVPTVPARVEEARKPTSIATRDSRGETRGRGVTGEIAKGEVRGEVKGEVNSERGVGEGASRRGVVETRGGGGVESDRRAEMKPVAKPEARPEPKTEVREAVKPTARGTRPAMFERGGESAEPRVTPVTTRQPRVMPQPVLSPESTEVKSPVVPVRAEPRAEPRMSPRAEKPSASPSPAPSTVPSSSAGIPVPTNTGRGERKIETPKGETGAGRGEARVVSPRRSTTTPTTTDGPGVVREAKPSVPTSGPKADPGSIPGVTPTTPARQRVRTPIGGGGSADQGGRSEATKPAVVSPSRVQQPGAMPGMMPGQSDEGKKPSSRGMGERRSGYGGGGVQVGGNSGARETKPAPRQAQPQPQPQARPAAPAPTTQPSAAPAPAPSQPAAAPSKGSGGSESKGGGERKRG